MSYNTFFLTQPRLNRRSTIAIVRGERFEGFVKEVLADAGIEDEYKAFLLVCLCGGLRVSEGLSLTRSSFEVDGEHLYANVTVLKKRDASERRMIRIHPLAVALVKSVVQNKIGTLFGWHRSTCLRKIQSYLAVKGICNHSLRHSAVSYFLFEAGLSREETAKLVHVNSKIIDVYAHLDERRTLKKLFK
jgi:integrase